MDTRKRGNVRFTFVRHGETGPAANNFDRPLTGKGRAQAERLRNLLGSGAQFDLVLHSPTPRTRDTAWLVFGVGAVLTELGEVQAIPELYTDESEDGQIISTMYRQLGPTFPLRTFLEHDDKGAMTRFAINGADAVLEAVEEAGAQNVLIVGHAVLLQAIATAIGGFFSIDDNELRDAVMGEAEAFILEPDGSITFVRQPTN